jgi:HEPN domain-containing protein
MTDVAWPALPKTEQEFEAMMQAMDTLLTDQGLTPFQRPLHVGRKLWEAFRWNGPAFPDKRIADLPGYEGEVLIAKANRWYEQTYGDRLKGDLVYGFSPARLGNNIWRVRAALTYGVVQLFADRNLQNRGNTFAVGPKAGRASVNILRSVDGLTQGFADRLTDQALREHMQFHLLMHEALQWRDSLPNTELLGMARHDYDECTSAVIGRRYGQARWAAEQAVEKTIKGLLTIGGTSYPTGGKNGHNLVHIAQLLKDKHGISLNAGVLALTECSPAVRYGEEASTEAQALAANHAVLGVLDELRRSSSVQALLSTYQEPTK